VEAIMSWLTPKCVKDIQAFLGLANFYCHFIQDFSKIATPLNNLTRKETVWRWGGTQQKAFDELKKRFVEGPILVATDYMCPLHMESDTSDLQQELYYQCYVKMRSGTHVHFIKRSK